MSFANMKVGTRLGLGFGVVILLLLVILVTGIINMGNMNQDTQLIVKDRYLKTALIAEVIEKTLDNARLLRNMVLIEDPVKVEGFRQSIEKNRAENNEALETLDKMITNQKGRELFDAVAKARSALNDHYPPLYEAFKKDHKSFTDEALAKHLV